MEAIDQGATTTSQVGDNAVAETRGPYSSHLPPLVQQPSRGNTLFHSPMEGHVDDTTCLDYGPNAPFWDTSMDQALLHLAPVQPLLKIFHQMKKNVDNTRKLFSVQEN